MITKVCIDNFRCFQNFELELSPLCLLLGDNGSGKSTFLDAIFRVWQVVAGSGAMDCFKASDLTAWDNKPFQQFALEMACDGDNYRYEVTVAYGFPVDKRWISGERLVWNSRLLYQRGEDQVQLYREAGPIDAAPYTTFPFNSGQSFIPMLETPGDSGPLWRFRKAMDELRFVRLDPTQIDQFSRCESIGLLPDGRNFSSWYRYLSSAHPEVVAAATETLREIIPGFGYLRFGGEGEVKWLEVSLEGVPEKIPFLQLSDGQRALIVLHTLLHAARQLGYDLFIDEPDNYISLREMQPWRNALEDLSLDDGRQVLLISHHPEFVSALAKSHGIFFTRPDNGPVRARLGYPVVKGLTAAETMARGWDDGKG